MFLNFLSGICSETEVSEQLYSFLGPGFFTRSKTSPRQKREQGEIMLLNDVFTKQSIILNLESKTKEDVFTELVEVIANVHPELDREEMLAVIQDREKKMNTSVTDGAAIPHGYYPGGGNIVGAIGFSQDGIDYETVDQQPVHVVFMIVLDKTFREIHLHVLSRILTLINSEGLSFIQEAKSQQEVFDILSRFN
jgi:mannitol/fructose-specific phosphotransferase system IIA component (Ntr-type)